MTRSRLLMMTLAFSLLSACAAGPQPMPVEQIQVPPPPNLTAPPQALPAPLSGRMRDLEANHREVSQRYHQLASQFCRLLLFLELPSDECKPFLTAPGATPDHP